MGFRNEISILRKLRETGEQGAILLLLDLYTVFDLSEDYGVPMTLVYGKHENSNNQLDLKNDIILTTSIQRINQSVYTNNRIHKINNEFITRIERELVEEHGADESSVFFHRLGILKKVKAVQWIPFIFESDNYEGQPIYPICTGNGRGIDGKIGRFSP